MPAEDPEIERIRDALGVVRLLYAVRRVKGRTLRSADDPLAAVGRELLGALAGARKAAPETTARRDAVERAARALFRLEGELGLGDHLPDAVRMAQARVAGRDFKKGVKDWHR